MNQESVASLTAVLEQAQHYILRLTTLEPSEAALRAGLSLLVLLGAWLLLWGARRVLTALSGDGDAQSRRARAGRWSMRIARIGVGVTALLLILNFWGVDIAALNHGAIGAALRIAGRLALILALAFAGVELCNVAITRLLGRIADRASHPRRAAQVRTLTPLLTGVIATSIIAIAAAMGLSEVGVEVGPLIAGAGIIGLAVGFGAQTLVKDFLTGIFLVLEDIVSVGDVIRIGDSTGAVEEMSLRTIKLRALDGTLHVFPYSEAQVIHNSTRGFSYAVFQLSVSYSADLAKALRLMRDVGAELRTDEEFAPSILADMEIMGVDQLADSAVVLKGRIRTLPGKQWALGREYLFRIKQAFDANGIEIPFPHLKLIAPDAAGFTNVGS